MDRKRRIHAAIKCFKAFICRHASVGWWAAREEKLARKSRESFHAVATDPLHSSERGSIDGVMIPQLIIKIYPFGRLWYVCSTYVVKILPIYLLSFSLRLFLILWGVGSIGAVKRDTKNYLLLLFYLQRPAASKPFSPLLLIVSSNFFFSWNMNYDYTANNRKLDAVFQVVRS